MPVDFTSGTWIHKPEQCRAGAGEVEIVTRPYTDFWQRSFYGFRNDNAPAIVIETEQNFTFSVRAAFECKTRFDQCGIIIYMDSDNWFKASIEYENSDLSRLGSVVTNRGHSDWATTDIEGRTDMWYRLSRRGPDFLVEYSADGVVYSQMRIFHLDCLGETTEEMGLADPPLPAESAVRFGLYACSPQDSSFSAKFSDIALGDCIWQAHA